MNAVKHPAKFTDALLPVFARYIAPNTRGLDPFAGTGKIFKLHDLVSGLAINAIEIEPEWAACDPRTTLGNALALPYDRHTFDWVCTSPVYGNRMSDHHDAKDASRRNTYRHTLGRALHPDNAGAMQFGDKYKELHTLAWWEVRRVLKPSGLFILNCKNFYRKGELIDVCGWHKQAIRAIGYNLIDCSLIDCPGNRYGQNGQLRIEHEEVMIFRRREVEA